MRRTAAQFIFIYYICVCMHCIYYLEVFLLGSRTELYNLLAFFSIFFILSDKMTLPFCNVCHLQRSEKKDRGSVNSNKARKTTTGNHKISLVGKMLPCSMDTDLPLRHEHGQAVNFSPHKNIFIIWQQ